MALVPSPPNETAARIPLEGVRVGHYTDSQAQTGCTVLYFDRPAVCGVDVGGGSPGTREITLLGPGYRVEDIHGLVLTGGSAFGLAAAEGVSRFLEEQGRGYDLGYARVPIVPAAVLNDLGVGDSKIRPNPDNGYSACLNASAEFVGTGNVGAGTGATVGKLRGLSHAMKGGQGFHSIELGRGVRICSLAAVNAYGNVVDPANGQTVAGTRNDSGNGFVEWSPSGTWSQNLENTTLAVILTNAKLTKTSACQVARLAQGGIVRTVNPSPTLVDGDIVFVVSLGEEDIAPNDLGIAAALALQGAILNGVRAAIGIPGFPAARDYPASGFSGRIAG